MIDPGARPFPIDAVRSRFPALARWVDGAAVAYLDGPAGTQVPRECIDGITRYLETSNANLHGAFLASQETDELVDDVHAAAADFLGAVDPAEISFGPNMTTITFAMSRAMGRVLSPGDELVVTRLDHDANVAPWLALAEERGATVRWVGIDTEDCSLKLDELASALSPRTRVVAVSLASNAVGTIPPVPAIARMVHDAGAWLWVDAVHAAPHMPINVTELAADFLVCSPYKFYGPHLGMLWARRELRDSLPALKVRPAPKASPGRWETGTQTHELLAGLQGTFRYLEWLGGERSGRRESLRAAMEAARSYEQSLLPRLIDGLIALGTDVHGITDPARFAERCPTVAFTMAGHHPRAIAAHLGKRGIAVWDGDYYAYELVRALGRSDSGGMVRVGLVHYNTIDEIDRLLNALEDLTHEPASA